MSDLRFFLILPLLLLLPVYGFAEPTNTVHNPYLTLEIRKAIRPYVIPSKHPALPVLNEIFQNSRPIIDDNTLREAGFRILYRKPRSFIRVINHPKLNGYLLKVNLDSDLRQKANKPAWYWFVKRCEGAEKIRSAIRKVHSKFFSVARKWIYVLPAYPAPPTGPGFRTQPIALLVEDMNIHHPKASKVGWLTKMTPRHLKELYKIISMAGGSSYRPDNICWRKQGEEQFAFIDTEYPNRTPDFGTIAKYLNPEMKQVWNNILQNNIAE